MDPQRLNDLVYIKYNRTLMKRYTEHHTIDPIILKDIDDSNEWLMGRMEDEGAAEDDLVFEDDDLTWGDVARASGAEELRSLGFIQELKQPKHQHQNQTQDHLALNILLLLL